MKEPHHIQALGSEELGGLQNIKKLYVAMETDISSPSS
jgi:hypothetical protein